MQKKKIRTVKTTPKTKVTRRTVKELKVLAENQLLGAFGGQVAPGPIVAQQN